MMTSTYRPRNSGHDYYGRGTYLITLVVSGRKQLLSHFSTETGSNALTLTPLGKVVEQTWLRTPEAQAVHGNHVVVHACTNGTLLILAPWDLDTMGDVNGIPVDSDYSRFHNLNTLAAEICSFYGEAKILTGH